MHDLGVLFLHLGRLQDARRILERALERAGHLLVRRQTATAWREVARIHHALAELALDDDDPIAARRHVDRALDLRAEHDGSETPIYGATLATAARVLQVAGDHEAAAKSFWRAIDLMTWDGNHTVASGQTLVMLADLLAETGRLDDADRLVKKAIEAMRGIDGEHALLCRALRARARIDRIAGRHDEAAANEAKVARIVALWCG